MVIVHLGHVPLEEHHHLRLFEALAGHVRVIYLEQGRRGEAADGDAPGSGPGLERRRIVPLLPCNRYPVLSRWNWWLGARAILADLGRRGVAGRVLVTQKPDMLPTLHGLGADLTVYTIVDDYVGLADPGDRDAVAAGHRRMLRQAGLAWAISGVMVEEARPYRADVRLVEQGVDHAAFAAPVALPSWTSSIAAPRVGAVGNLNDRIDWALVEGIARSRARWSFVLVGPLYGAGPRTREAVARLRTLPNVHMLPEVKPDVLPAAIAGLDVGLILYAPGPGTLAINPLKLYQYLAAGRAVVSTPIPSVQALGDAVMFASTVEGFVGAIERALAEPDAAAAAAARRRRARDFDWEEVAARRLAILSEAIEVRAGRSPAPPAGKSRLPIP
jgi:glycosyltransferase involved in cell wall biosynthesis